MPLDQAVLDWQVIPSVAGDEDRAIEVVAVAARREMLAGLIEAVASAGLRPVGIDHSAFALIRALRGSDAAARRRPRSPSAIAEGDAPAGRRRPPLLPPRRHHQPRRRPRDLLPLQPRARLRDRGHRPVAVGEQRAQPRARAPVARPRRPRRAGRGGRGRPADRRRHPRRALLRASRPWSTSCAARSSTTRARRMRCASTTSSSPAPGRRSRASSTACSVSCRCRRRAAVPQPLSHRRGPRGRSPDPLLRTRTGGVGAAGQPDPARGSPRRPRAAARRGRLLRGDRRRWPWP